MATSPRISPSLAVSSLKFWEMVTSADVTEIYELLLDHPTLFLCYLHFSALSRTLKRQELLLKQTKEELDMAFCDMTNNDFYDAFAFFIACKRNEQRQSSSLPPHVSTIHPSSSSYSSSFPTTRISRSPSPPSYSSSETIIPCSPRITLRNPMGQRLAPISRVRVSRCSNCGEQGHHIEQCPNFWFVYCNGQGHIEISCPWRHEFTVLPTGVCLSPVGQVIHYTDRTVMTRPYTRSWLDNTQSSRSSSLPQ